MPVDGAERGAHLAERFAEVRRKFFILRRKLRELGGPSEAEARDLARLEQKLRSAEPKIAALASAPAPEVAAAAPAPEVAAAGTATDAGAGAADAAAEAERLARQRARAALLSSLRRRVEDVMRELDA